MIQAPGVIFVSKGLFTCPFQQSIASVLWPQRSQYRYRECLGEIKYVPDFNILLVYQIFIVTLEILLGFYLKLFCFWPSADDEPMSNDIVHALPWPGNTKRGSTTVPLTSCLTGLDQSVSQIKTKNFSCHTAESKPVKQEVNGTVILPPLVFLPWLCMSALQVYTSLWHFYFGVVMLFRGLQVSSPY